MAGFLAVVGVLIIIYIFKVIVEFVPELVKIFGGCLKALANFILEIFKSIALWVKALS